MTTLPPMTEREWQQMVLDYALLKRWRSYHTFDSRRSAPGFPDLVLVRPPRLIFAELKAEKGKLTVEQAAWVASLEKTPVEVYVWRPSQFDDVMRILA